MPVVFYFLMPEGRKLRKQSMVFSDEEVNALFNVVQWPNAFSQDGVISGDDLCALHETIYSLLYPAEGDSKLDEETTKIVCLLSDIVFFALLNDASLQWVKTTTLTVPEVNALLLSGGFCREVRYASDLLSATAPTAAKKDTLQRHVARACRDFLLSVWDTIRASKNGRRRP